MTAKEELHIKTKVEKMNFLHAKKAVVTGKTEAHLLNK